VEERAHPFQLSQADVFRSEGHAALRARQPSRPMPARAELTLLTYLLLLLFHELLIGSKHFCHAGPQQLLQGDFRKSVAADPVHLLAQTEEEALDVPGWLLKKTALFSHGL